MCTNVCGKSVQKKIDADSVSAPAVPHTNQCSTICRGESGSHRKIERGDVKGGKTLCNWNWLATKAKRKRKKNFFFRKHKSVLHLFQCGVVSYLSNLTVVAGLPTLFCSRANGTFCQGFQEEEQNRHFHSARSHEPNLVHILRATATFSHALIISLFQRKAHKCGPYRHPQHSYHVWVNNKNLQKHQDRETTHCTFMEQVLGKQHRLRDRIGILYDHHQGENNKENMTYTSITELMHLLYHNIIIITIETRQLAPRWRMRW